MERLAYSEARHWFWARTVVWALPAALTSAMAHFAYSDGLFEELTDRIFISLAGGGIGAIALAILAAYISMQMPWMRLGFRISYLVNGPFTGVVAGVAALLVCGFVLSFIQESPPNAVEHRAAYEAYLILVDHAYRMMVFSCGATAFWGFIFGSWFAMRRDKYFVEPIYD